jgi:peptidoglycan hydrolase CwlO-like protein
LGASLAEFESLRNSLNSSNHELSAFREKFATMQSEHMEEVEMEQQNRKDF